MNESGPRAQREGYALTEPFTRKYGLKVMHRGDDIHPHRFQSQKLLKRNAVAHSTRIRPNVSMTGCFFIIGKLHIERCGIQYGLCSAVIS